MGGGFWTGVVVGWIAGAVVGYFARKFMGKMVESKGGEIGTYFKADGKETKVSYHAGMRRGQYLFDPSRVLVE